MEKTSKVSVTPKNKGNRTTEIIIGKASASFEAGLKKLAEVVPLIGNLKETIETSTLEVSNLEDKKGALQQDLENNIAQNKITLQQQYESDAKEFVDKWLDGKGCVIIVEGDLDDLKRKADMTEAKMEEEVMKAVAKAVGTEKSNSAMALRMATLEHEKKEASNTAEITMLKQQNVFLEKQCTMWEKQLNDERIQQTERSKHGAINNLTIGGGQQGK